MKVGDNRNAGGRCKEKRSFEKIDRMKIESENEKHEDGSSDDAISKKRGVLKKVRINCGRNER